MTQKNTMDQLWPNRPHNHLPQRMKAPFRPPTVAGQRFNFTTKEQFYGQNILIKLNQINKNNNKLKSCYSGLSKTKHLGMGLIETLCILEMSSRERRWSAMGKSLLCTWKCLQWWRRVLSIPLWWRDSLIQSLAYRKCSLNVCQINGYTA